MKEFNLETDNKIESGFNIPEQYFETLEAKIMAQIHTNPVKVISIFETRRFWISSIAAIFLIVISAVFYLNHHETTTINPEGYLTYQTNLTTEEIVEYLTDEDIATIASSLDLYDQETLNYANEYLQ